MNSTLHIGSLSGTLISDYQQTVTGARETAFKKEAAWTRGSNCFRWSSCIFAEASDAILTILTVVYMTGAVGLGAMLIFYILHP
jgi:hypothetical protein